MFVERYKIRKFLNKTLYIWCLSITYSIVEDFAYTTNLLIHESNEKLERSVRSIAFFSSQIRKWETYALIPLVDAILSADLAFSTRRRRAKRFAQTRRMMHSNGMRASCHHARTGPFTCNRSRRSATYARILLADQLHV